MNLMNSADKKSTVRNLFDNIAPSYDMLNHMLSLNIDKLWRRRFAKIVANFKPHNILDVATGTADLAIALSQQLLPEVHVTGVDIAQNMLDIGSDKIARKNLDKYISLKWADAENLPFDDLSFDCITAAFGVRNFANLQAGLDEMCRVARHGAKCIIMEFSVPDAPVFKHLFKFYFHNILPSVAACFAHNKPAYQYLPQSVDNFPNPNAVMQKLTAAGFSDVQTVKLTGGVVYIYIATKP